jgi:hypothetical protein
VCVIIALAFTAAPHRGRRERAAIGDPLRAAALDTLLGWQLMCVERSRGGVFA